MAKASKILKNGIFTENPTFVSFLGMCPTLATTTTLDKAVGMALATFIVLIGSNLIISLIKNFTPAEIRIPVYVVIIATLVKTTELLLHAYTPAVFDSLGIFLPLIVVNCIVLGRAEAFASKNTVWSSFLDAVGTGIGFLLALSAVGLVRELGGTGAIEFKSFFDNTQSWISFRLFDAKFAWGLLSDPKGAFLTLGLIAGTIGAINITTKARKAKKANLATERVGG